MASDKDKDDAAAPARVKDDAAPPARAVDIRVRATQDGFYKGCRVRKGVVFTLLKPRDYSKRWMEKVDASEADQLGTPPSVDELRARRQQPAGGKDLSQKSRSSGGTADDVI